jgi:splicing factor 45
MQQQAIWDPSEPYDPSRPNDYNEYKVWKHREHEERMERLAKERRMEAQKRLRRSSSRSDYTESEPEDARPRKTGTIFLDPITFDASHGYSCKGRFGGHDDRWSREDDEYQDGIGSFATTRPALPDMHMSGEEAYQRRLAMSTGFSASMPIDDDAAGEAAIGFPAPLAKAETGEEAYLRRVAMSQGPAPPPSQPAPSQSPSSTGDEEYQRRVALSSQQSLQFPPQHQQEPSEPLSDLSGYNPFAPQSAPPPPSATSATSTGNDTPSFEQRVRNSRNTAAAIAARFSALAPPAEGKDLSDSAPEESGPESSARCAS